MLHQLLALHCLMNCNGIEEEKWAVNVFASLVNAHISSFYIVLNPQDFTGTYLLLLGDPGGRPLYESLLRCISWS